MTKIPINKSLLTLASTLTNISKLFRWICRNQLKSLNLAASVDRSIGFELAMITNRLNEMRLNGVIFVLPRALSLIIAFRQLEQFDFNDFYAMSQSKSVFP